MYGKRLKKAYYKGKNLLHKNLATIYGIKKAKYDPLAIKRNIIRSNELILPPQKRKFPWKFFSR